MECTCSWTAFTATSCAAAKAQGEHIRSSYFIVIILIHFSGNSSNFHHEYPSSQPFPKEFTWQTLLTQWISSKENRSRITRDPACHSASCGCNHLPLRVTGVLGKNDGNCRCAHLSANFGAVNWVGYMAKGTLNTNVANVTFLLRHNLLTNDSCFPCLSLRPRTLRHVA
jgi:hypothetical protein